MEISDNSAIPIRQNGNSCLNFGVGPAVDSALHRLTRRGDTRRVVHGICFSLLFIMLGSPVLGIAENGESYHIEIYEIQRHDPDGRTYFFEGSPGEPELLAGILDPSISARRMYAWYTYNPNDRYGRTAQAVNLDAHVSAGDAVLSWFRGAVNGLMDFAVADLLAPFGITRFGEFSGDGQDQYVSGKVFNFTGQPGGARVITETSAITDKYGRVTGELTPQHLKLYYPPSFWDKVGDAVFGTDVYGTSATELYLAQLPGSHAADHARRGR
jgi:hypothetical protein